jgi:thiosulfate reductase / polysulfide reductase chain A
MSYVLDEKVKRAGIAANFAELKQLGMVEKKQAFVPKTTFATHDGKINIYVKEFADKGFDPLPKWKPKRDEPSGQYPFYLLTVIPPQHTRCSTENNRILNEILPTNQVHMNPQAARGLGLSDGDLVKVRSRVGEIQLPVRFPSRSAPTASSSRTASATGRGS